ncbi:MAG TPA: Hpt domain-containing protein, partial [Desulfobacterales bacterium]|nr:Hpt domain-containing protein [Desulfobacterales bacterium]
MQTCSCLPPPCLPLLPVSSYPTHHSRLARFCHPFSGKDRGGRPSRPCPGSFQKSAGKVVLTFGPTSRISWILGVSMCRAQPVCQRAVSSPSKKPSLAFSTTVGQSRASANLTNSLALSEPAEFGGTSLRRTQPVFQRAAREKESREKEAGEKAVLLDSDAALRRLAGNRRLYHRLLAEFAREQRDAPDRIRAALAAERERARRLAHTLKGVSGNIGAMAVHLQAKKVEAAVVEENDSALDQALRVLQEVLA